jgi:hypothetical protein
LGDACCLHLEGLALFVDWYTEDGVQQVSPKRQSLCTNEHSVMSQKTCTFKCLGLLFSVAAKHKETKQFYTLYNTLDDKKLYLSKELTLLNSILDNYTE